MNKIISNYVNSNHPLRDVLVPFSLSFFLVLFLVWIIMISLRTTSIPFTPNNQTVITNDQVKGGDDS